MIVASLVAVGAFAEGLRRSWVDTGSAATVAASERQGIVYLHPMVALIGKLGDAQSAAVRGDRVDDAVVRKAVASVATADQKVGRALGTSQRFTDLRGRIEAALTGGATGRTAYQTYSDVMALTIDLFRQVGDESQLIHDQDLDSYYVMVAAVEQLPDAIVNAGRAADLVALAGSSQLQGDDAIRAAVARYSVATDGEQVTAGVNKAVNATTDPELGTSVAQPLDTFRAAVDAFAPPTMLAQLAGAVDAANLAAGAHQVFTAAVPLAHRLLYSLDDLLAARQAGIRGQQQFIERTAGLGGAAWLVLLVLLVAVRRRPAMAPTAPAATGPTPARQEDSASVVPRRLPDSRLALLARVPPGEPDDAA
jgi:hypothetical protein